MRMKSQVSPELINCRSNSLIFIAVLIHISLKLHVCVFFKDYNIEISDNNDLSGYLIAFNAVLSNHNIKNVFEWSKYTISEEIFSHTSEFVHIKCNN